MSDKPISSLVSGGSDVSDDSDWLDVEPDEESVNVVSLLDSQTFPSWTEMLNYCKKQHEFDFATTVQRLQLDFHGAVKLVNFIRERVQQHQPLPDSISHDDIEDDRYLRPVLENDALIMSLDEILEQEQERDLNKATPDATGESIEELLARKHELEAELELVRTQFANYRLAVQETLDRRWADDAEQPVSEAAAEESAGNYYFESYATNDIHETMLKDTVRTDAYRDFIYGNKHLFKDKVVLDIGCGTGILSMFCAKAGAARVIAVDKSDIIQKATENVFNNGLSDIVTCLRGAIEEVKLPVDEVDVIVSEWMGYCLLYEAMLPSVLYARDKYLKPGGLLVPSSATLWIAPVEDTDYISEHISYWRDVYGFDMKAMQEGIFDEIRIEALPKSSICGGAFPFRTLDLRSVQPQDLSFTAKWESSLSRELNHLDGFLLWFDNFFATSGDEPMPEPNTTPDMWVSKKHGNVAFTTGPSGTVTHWKQGLLLLPPNEAVTVTSPSCTISGRIEFAALEENARALRIDASWSVEGQGERNLSWKLK